LLHRLWTTQETYIGNSTGWCSTSRSPRTR
jgi:hypothetical protein